MSKSVGLTGVLVGSALQLVPIPFFGHVSDVPGAAMYGPQAALITELFGNEVRYRGASLPRNTRAWLAVLTR